MRVKLFFLELSKEQELEKITNFELGKIGKGG